MTTPFEGDVYKTGSKQILVTRDPIYVHPAVTKQGNYIGRQPHDYLPLAICVTVLNPLLGPIAILFAFKSSKSFTDGDIIYATKWSNYAFLTSMLVIVTSCLAYVALAFALSGPELRGGHSY
ncbi:unnamed protein product [Candidula unifasciata]|uniref:Uncharacterized protein n=1 Tax=Candidula unifasciata TaxID=100452 RepID=A0A8S3ZLS0_9EUPU|nr:unnamed protein product [Candidula unifasciata]